MCWLAEDTTTSRANEMLEGGREGGGRAVAERFFSCDGIIPAVPSRGEPEWSGMDGCSA